MWRTNCNVRERCEKWAAGALRNKPGHHALGPGRVVRRPAIAETPAAVGRQGKGCSKGHLNQIEVQYEKRRLDRAVVWPANAEGGAGGRGSGCLRVQLKQIEVRYLHETVDGPNARFRSRRCGQRPRSGTVLPYRSHLAAPALSPRSRRPAAPAAWHTTAAHCEEPSPLRDQPALQMGIALYMAGASGHSVAAGARSSLRSGGGVERRWAHAEGTRMQRARAGLDKGRPIRISLRPPGGEEGTGGAY